MSQPAAPLNLDAIQARHDAASPGVSTDYVTRAISRTYRYGLLGHPEPLMTQTEAEAYLNGGGRGFAEGDAPFHANAYRDIPALIARVRELGAEVERLSADRMAVRSAIALDLMELHDDPATPERNRAGLRAAARRIPAAQDGGY
jgi:hypothetical protein